MRNRLTLCLAAFFAACAALLCARPAHSEGEGAYADYDRLRAEHWAWQPVREAKPPQVMNADWPRGDVDRFVLAALEKNGLRPVADADRMALIRRVTFDLTGLPPTPEEVDAFLGDQSSDAFEKVVDRLLASPRFGEKWGRHWLDVARYAESTGMSRNFPYPHAWRYRDYVIDSFNKDKPYNQFVVEQIAGDLLPWESAAQRNEQLVATGFLALGPKELNERDRAKFLMDVADEQIDVTTRAVLGLTVACARCHDHKFDPIPTEDYYAMAGIFRSTTTLVALSNRQGGRERFDPNLTLQLIGEGAPPAAEVKAHEAKVADLTARLERARQDFQEVRRAANGGGGKGKAGGGKAKAGKGKGKGKNKGKAKAGGGGGGGRPAVRQARQRVERLEAELQALKKSAPGGGPMAIGVRDEPSPADTRVHVRGETSQLGDQVPRGFISLIKFPSRPTINRAQSGRLELARWLTSAKNPLTARVMVNRVWHHLFGSGLVPTLDNFGSTGETPSHPELLDYLAARFVREGWSVKKLIRKLVLSRTYQLSTAYDSSNAAVDPANRLLWRMSQRRLEAEAVRDAMLAAGGNLDANRPNGSPVMNLPYAEVGRLQRQQDRRAERRQAKGRRGKGRQQQQQVQAQAATSPFDGDYRSVYLPVVRGLVPPALDVFDFAEPSLSTGSRDVTTVATQALYLMNNPFVVEQSGRLADRVLARADLDDAGRVDLAYRLALSRPATDAERQRVLNYIEEYRQLSDVEDYRQSILQSEAKKADESAARRDAWASFCQTLFAGAEFRYLN